MLPLACACYKDGQLMQRIMWSSSVYCSSSGLFFPFFFMNFCFIFDRALSRSAVVCIVESRRQPGVLDF